MKKIKNKSDKNIFFLIFDELGKLGDGDGFGEFDFKKFFKGLFIYKTEEELEDSLIVGTSKTTPSISELLIKYPEPWLFGRLIIGSLVLFYGFVGIYKQFEVVNLIPAIIFTGSFSVPISTIFLFFEINIRRNISIWQVMRLILMGGFLSIFITIILFENSSLWNGPTGAWFASFIEEPAKLVAVLLLVKNKQKYPYILNGLLFGASVGCGFAAFESAGYALSYGMDDINSLIGLIQLRGILSPFAHIIWTAIGAASFWRVLNGGKFNYKLFFKKKFFIPFFVIIFLHAIWNSASLIPFKGLYFILGIVGWTLVLSHINLGIIELKNEQKGKIN